MRLRQQAKSLCPRTQATNLVKAGYKVTVWNRNTAKCESLRELGAEVCGRRSRCRSAARSRSAATLSAARLLNAVPRCPRKERGV